MPQAQKNKKGKGNAKRPPAPAPAHELTAPELTAPELTAPAPAPELTAPELTAPELTAPELTAPAPAPEVYATLDAALSAIGKYARENNKAALDAAEKAARAFYTAPAPVKGGKSPDKGNGVKEKDADKVTELIDAFFANNPRPWINTASGKAALDVAVSKLTGHGLAVRAAAASLDAALTLQLCSELLDGAHDTLPSASWINDSNRNAWSYERKAFRGIIQGIGHKGNARYTGRYGTYAWDKYQAAPAPEAAPELTAPAPAPAPEV